MGKICKNKLKEVKMFCAVSGLLENRSEQKPEGWGGGGELTGRALVFLQRHGAVIKQIL